MRYEKKMLILTGEGKGVVLLEKSGLGVRFALRTFGVPPLHELNAGIVTPDNVFVRALPSTADPSAVFYIDIPSLDELHFAVFDAKLRLYGAIGKKMWESNLMDLLNKHTKPIAAPMPNPSMLPPLSAPPRSLPLPDGTGIPQSRLSIYGDDALAENDFYTPFDIPSRMQIVDGFLDTPRILDGLAPTITPASESAAAIDGNIGVQPKQTVEQTVEQNVEQTVQPVEEPAEQPDVGSVEHSIEQSVEQTAEQPVEQSVEQPIEESAEQPVEQSVEQPPEQREKPWEREARWLASQGSREPVIRGASVKKVKAKAEIHTIRAADFFERRRADVDKLFAEAPIDEELSKLLPELNWVKVPMGDRSISVGRNGDAALCYAVFGNYEKVSPLGAEAQWLPRLKTAPTGKGYWLVFQSLSTGQIV